MDHCSNSFPEAARAGDMTDFHRVVGIYASTGTWEVALGGHPLSADLCALHPYWVQ